MATYDHGWNQSIVVQLIIPGNFLDLVENLSPTGENNNIMCNLLEALLIKNFHNSAYVSLPFGYYFLYNGLTSPQMLSYSSLGYKAGISPYVNKLFILSKNISSLIS